MCHLLFVPELQVLKYILNGGPSLRCGIVLSKNFLSELFWPQIYGITELFLRNRFGGIVLSWNPVGFTDHQFAQTLQKEGFIATTTTVRHEYITKQPCSNTPSLRRLRPIYNPLTSRRKWQKLYPCEGVTGAFLRTLWLPPFLRNSFLESSQCRETKIKCARFLWQAPTVQRARQRGF